MRPLSADIGLLQNADGSARFSCGHSSAIVAVHGPVEESRQTSQLADRMRLFVVVRPRSGMSSQREKALEVSVTKRLQRVVETRRFPRTRLTVVCQIEQDDGAMLSVLLNCAFLALLDTGCVPVRSSVVALSVAYVDKSPLDEATGMAMGMGWSPEMLESGRGGLIVDPCLEEIHRASACSLCLCTDAVTGTVEAVLPDGSLLADSATQRGEEQSSGGITALSSARWDEAVALAKKASEVFLSFVRGVVEPRLGQLVQLWPEDPLEELQTNE
uniref:Exoribonuclease phosphorolytic domain-containing protein n=1 Tax=Chromera velia CCMP2878 TaxID=1169474 RepID=A0A0G4IFU6_9ALVE|eukprot:Cvel_14103.t1-p1 / transcript=Cvel_14103.t1 / gene=Cvel_14103 / organism=Chromera_velia_CCMP2878 / gene_product=Exosome complex component RRP46, putative / transcript_product=Exosome complex component RRP46, putative / location=Cvel_scaffold992:8216-10650(-) / protein_length=271 / sequence_SO=supercontig / SO=protein_coding / is_pseudo=false